MPTHYKFPKTARIWNEDNALFEYTKHSRAFVKFAEKI